MFLHSNLNGEDRDDTCITLGRTSKIRWMTSSFGFVLGLSQSWH